MRLGAHIGVSIPEIGIGTGMLVGASRYFALAALCKEHSGKFKAHSKTLLTGTVAEAQACEMEHWGCTSKQVLVMLMCSAGFSAAVVDAVAAGIERNASLMGSSEEHLRSTLANFWIEALLLSGEALVLEVPDRYLPEEIEVERLMSLLQKIDNNAPHWLNKSDSDLSEKKTPRVFAKPPEPEGDFEVPEELADVFSLDEITSMEEEDFDALIDQIDTEEETGKPVGGVSKEEFAKLENEL